MSESVWLYTIRCSLKIMVDLNDYINMNYYGLRDRQKKTTHPPLKLKYCMIFTSRGLFSSWSLTMTVLHDNCLWITSPDFWCDQVAQTYVARSNQLQVITECSPGITLGRKKVAMKEAIRRKKAGDELRIPYDIHKYSGWIQFIATDFGQCEVLNLYIFNIFCCNNNNNKRFVFIQTQ